MLMSLDVFSDIISIYIIYAYALVATTEEVRSTFDNIGTISLILFEIYLITRLIAALYPWIWKLSECFCEDCQRKYLAPDEDSAAVTTFAYGENSYAIRVLSSKASGGDTFSEFPIRKEVQDKCFGTLFKSVFEDIP